ncbi:MAG TPA: HXXEE domain-containing protein [Puia sp.]|nr:HXXEE domain-containing protein [Puia sp.]
MLKFLKTRWFDIGAIIALVIIKGVLLNARLMGNIQSLLWLAFAALLLFQAEEYHWPGSYPEWLNKIAGKQKKNYRAPLSVKSNFIINVLVEWTTFIIAAILEEDALWLGVAVMVFCFGSFVKHVFYYNIKARTWYNPGVATSIVCMLPVSAFFFIEIIRGQKTEITDYLLGFPLGIFFTLVTSVEVINWIKSRHFRILMPKHS